MLSIGWIIKYRHWLIGAAVAVALLLCAWRVQVYINHLKQTSFLEGYNAATGKCELDKANTIEAGNKTRAKVDHEIQKLQDPAIIEFLDQHGWLRPS